MSSYIVATTLVLEWNDVACILSDATPKDGESANKGTSILSQQEFSS